MAWLVFVASEMRDKCFCCVVQRGLWQCLNIIIIVRPPQWLLGHNTCLARPSVCPSCLRGQVLYHLRPHDMSHLARDVFFLVLLHALRGIYFCKSLWNVFFPQNRASGSVRTVSDVTCLVTKSAHAPTTMTPFPPRPAANQRCLRLSRPRSRASL